jgi:hypothetical protein
MISAKNIADITCKRIDNRKEIYKAILLQFCKKIRSAVETHQTQSFLSVPEYMFGFPTYDRGVATNYLIRQLQLLGYTVSKYSEFEIYVTWVATKKEKELDILPQLMNLRKTADNIRKKHGH